MNALLKMRTPNVGELFVNGVSVGELDKERESDFWYGFNLNGIEYDLNFYEYENIDDVSQEERFEWFATIYLVENGSTDTTQVKCKVDIDWSEVLNEGSY